jgi:SAM-dependent methyltransferase
MCWRRQVMHPSAKKLAAIYARQDSWFQPIRTQLFRRIGLVAKNSILDLGAGTGQTIPELKRRSDGSVVGIDHDPDAASLSGGAVTIGEADALPFDEDVFDVIFTQMFFLWAKPLDRILSEIQRVLQPGGHLLVAAEPDYDGLIEQPENCNEVRKYADSLAAEGADLGIGRKLAGILRDAGFAVEEGMHQSDSESSAANEPLYAGLTPPTKLHIPYHWIIAKCRA